MKKCYVYVLMDPSIKMKWVFENKTYYNKPFYIGMGSGYRIGYHGSNTDLQSTKNDFKKEYILKLNEKGLHIIREKIIENILPEEACDMEIELIKKFGRIIDKSGILTNISKGGELFMYGSNHPRSSSVYQYSMEGKFIKEFLSLSDVKIDNLKYISNRISNCSIYNEKNFPKKIHNACGYIWFKEYKGDNIEKVIIKNDNRIHQYDENFKLINIYDGASDLNKNGYPDSSVYNAISKKYIYKNSYWSKGIIANKDDYRNRISNCKKCFQYSLDGYFIKKHNCVVDIPAFENIKITAGSISENCRLNEKVYPIKLYTCAGYIWMYEFKGNKLNQNI